MAKSKKQPLDNLDTNKVLADQAKNKAKMLVALEQTMGVVTTACRAVGIARQTHHNWLKSDKEYKRNCEELNDVALDFSESKMYEKIESGDTSMIKFHLSHRGKKRGYSKRIEFEQVDEFKDKYKDKTPEEIAMELSVMAQKMAKAISK